ncbi:MAG TPA: DEAD/DEAH box helicase [Proteobacteria bacterium]|nr:ATP-dependent RNA helicase RhlB [bacterium BMS3Abin14]HDL53875.1 DEAD/DEAH box helicase [Pseudomonadota bacterium]
MTETDFNSLNLPQTVLKGIKDAGFTEMSPIQRQAMPIALSGKDLCAQAQTGTGKTAAFLISLFSEILQGGIRKNDPRPQALILAPTRELAMQIYREGVLLGSHTGLRMAAVYGGEGFTRQEKKLRSGLDLVVGTPGRLLDFVRRKILDLGGVRYLVIDEADRLLDLGFWDELKHILRRLPPVKSRQSMLFSATLDGSTRKIVSGHMNHPVNIAIHPERITAKGIDQTVYHVDQDFKFRLLLGILAREEIPKGLIFTNMKITAAWVAKKLEENGFGKVGLLTGDMRQPMRNRVLERFKEGKVPLLVASDVASRGLHIDDVTHIINYDVPQDPEDYVHRIGRTARAGKKGKAYTLACDRYCWSLPDIEKLLTHPLPYQVPYEKDYGVDRTPEFTIRKMIREEGRKKRKPAGEHSTGKRSFKSRGRNRPGR